MTEFSFQDGWRTYECRLERQKGSITDGWWWFQVTGDQHRYAPFAATPGESRDKVKDRILAYHTNLLARRAAPPEPRNQWGRPAKNANKSKASGK